MEINGQSVSLDEYLESLPLDEIRERLAIVRAEIARIRADLDQEATIPRRGQAWAVKARSAVRFRRIEENFLAGHIERAEKQARFEAHISAVPDAQMVALEYTRDLMRLLIERDERAARRGRNRDQRFAIAAAKILPPEVLDAIWRAAKDMDPDNPIWDDQAPLPNRAHEAIRRARKLRAINPELAAALRLEVREALEQECLEGTAL